MKPYLNYSEMSTYAYDKELYVNRYVYGLPEEKSPEAELGIVIHEALEKYPHYPLLRTLKEMELPLAKRYNVMKLVEKAPKEGKSEVGMKADLGDGIILYGVFDKFDPKVLMMRDYKTTKDTKRWNATLVDSHLQFSFYSLIFFLNCHQYFRDIWLTRMAIETGTIRNYRTARGPKDLKDAREKIWDFVRELKREGIWQHRKSRKEIEFLQATRRGATLKI